MSLTKSELVCDSSAIPLQVGCGHKHPCVILARQKRRLLDRFFLGAETVGLAGLKSQRVEARCDLNLRP